jgi:ubiquitin carboxyl-terminal hydrolase 5/13
MSFDIPRICAERAWFNTQGQGPEAAAEWYFTHMGDASLQIPLNSSGSSAASSTSETVDPVALAQLESMGFSTKICTKALKETKGNIERAADWLFSHMDEPMDEEQLPAAGSQDPKKEDAKPEDGPGRM